MGAAHPGQPVWLRGYLPSDLPILFEIDQACFPPGVSYSRGELARFLARAGAKAWVAEKDGQIVGFLIAGREEATLAHLVTIDVRSECRRRGVGRILMDAAEKWARDEGVELIYLETAEDNLIAQRFYEARGYTKVDRVEEYYADGQAAWVMAKSLIGPG